MKYSLLLSSSSWLCLAISVSFHTTMAADLSRDRFRFKFENIIVDDNQETKQKLKRHVSRTLVSTEKSLTLDELQNDALHEDISFRFLDGMFTQFSMSMNIQPTRPPVESPDTSPTHSTQKPNMNPHSPTKVPSHSMTFPPGPTTPKATSKSPSVTSNPMTFPPAPTIPKAPSKSPSVFEPTISPMGPSIPPQINTSKTPLPVPSFSPFESSDNPSLSTTNDPTSSTISPSSVVSDQPSDTLTESPVLAFPVFQCNEDGVAAVPKPYPDNMLTTMVDLGVTYSVDTAASLESYRSELERKIVAASLAGALQCGTVVEGPDFAGTEAALASVPIKTTETGELCTPQTQDGLSTCRILETELQLILREDIDSQVAAFLAYIFLQEEMSDSAFIADIPELQHLEYLQPLPLLPPIVSETDNIGKPGAITANEGNISVSSWTLGAVVAMCAGGFIALWAWVRNRRTRNRRHMQLVEDLSVGSPDASYAAP